MPLYHSHRSFPPSSIAAYPLLAIDLLGSPEAFEVLGAEVSDAVYVKRNILSSEENSTLYR